MTVFDTDVFVEILRGNPQFVDRAATIPEESQCISIVTVEEILRGRLHAIRRAESGKGLSAVTVAYDLLQQSVADLGRLTVLPFTHGANSLFEGWRRQGVRVPTHDLRIAAISVEHYATLVSRNRRDFERIPGILVEFWT